MPRATGGRRGRRGNGDVDRGVRVQAGEHVVALAATRCCGAAGKDGRAACAATQVTTIESASPRAAERGDHPRASTSIRDDDDLERDRRARKNEPYAAEVHSIAPVPDRRLLKVADALRQPMVEEQVTHPKAAPRSG